MIRGLYPFTSGYSNDDFDRKKTSVNLAKTYSIAKATMTAPTTSTEKVGDLHSCCAFNIFQRMPMKIELLCISCEWKPACSV